MGWKENGLRLAKGMHWMGRPVSSLSPAELVAALGLCAQQNIDQRERHATERRFLHDVARRLR